MQFCVHGPVKRDWRAETKGVVCSKSGMSPNGQTVVVLSARQLQVARLVAQGLQDKQIAGELSISEETVGHHLRRAFAKLRIHSRSELVVLVLAGPTDFV